MSKKQFEKDLSTSRKMVENYSKLSNRNNTVTFLPFKNVYYMTSIIANQSKNKYVF